LFGPAVQALMRTAPSDHHCLTAKFRGAEQFERCKKRIHVEVGKYTIDYPTMLMS